jgi:hypothetical protein
MKRATFERFYSPEGDGGILPPANPAPAPEPTPEARAGRVTCEGCGCALDSKGKIILRGDGLKAHIEREDEVRRLEKELATATESVRELGVQVAAFKAKEKRSILY